MAENIGDYCYSRVQRGLEDYDACMRSAESGANGLGTVGFLIIVGIVVAIYFYNKGKDQQESGR